MTDRPIIFSGPMVRALLAGRKTQTRRLATSPLARCAPDDRLYVREAWSHSGAGVWSIADARMAMGGRPLYRASDDGDAGVRWWTSIHMPRAFSRLTLIVEAVRVEPLQAMEGQHPLESDAIAEGVHRIHHGDGEHYYHAFRDEPHPQNWCDPTDAFRELWSTLHTKPGERWEDNPDVVALTFRVVRGNIDQVPA